MGKIRDRMLEELNLRGLSAATTETYLMCCRQFVAHYMRSPEQLGAAETKAFIVHLAQERKSSASSVCVYVAAIRFLYRVVLRRPEAVEDLPRPKIPRHLPCVPTRDEVRRILEHIRSPKYRTILTFAYGAGLRLAEICQLKKDHFDAKEGLLHVRGGKGNKDRLVPLSPGMLRALEHYRVVVRPPGRLLFPGRTPEVPVHETGVQRALKVVLRELGINKPLTPHSFRHGFATHLLEDGEDVRVIQAVLGHAHVQTTAHYARVTTTRLRKVKSPVDRIFQRAKEARAR